MKVKFPKEQIDLFNQIGTIVNTANGNTYRYLPFWFKETEQEDVYELLTFEKLSDELIETIKDMRDSNFKDVKIYAKGFMYEPYEERM